MVDIDTMPAGREMDALVAEKVMGIKCHCPPPSDCPCHGWADPYSTEIYWAWKVVARLDFLYHDVTIANDCEDHDAARKWFVTVTNVKTSAPTAQLAICRAALKAVAPW